MPHMILIIDDEDNIRSGLTTALKQENYNVQNAQNGCEGLEKVDLFLPDMIICDIKMPDINGIDLLKTVKSKHPDIPVIMLTGHAGLDEAVEAMKLGAYDFLTKPVHLDKLFQLIERAIKETEQKNYTKELEDRLDAKKGFDHIIGHSPAIQNLIDIVKQVAPTDATVLLLGESGVGKEAFAKSIYEHSLRSNGPFIKVNCGALPETLLESELFGHEKGAFTGASARRKGRFERADQGTIFLDEIGDISPMVQLKLLRVLQEREFERVGGEETLTTDIRIIAATNKNLQEYVNQGRFREDLYYRLNVVEIVIPPLRDRKEDIPELVSVFLKTIAEKYKKPALEFSPQALKKLLNYSWPGNVRELQNAVETAVVLSSSSIIDATVLPDRIQNYQPQ
ncbi:MAG: sigma-54-dependent transcriptional regulator [Brevinemataceae bacterium]